MVARLVWDQEVESSNLSAPTVITAATDSRSFRTVVRRWLPGLATLADYRPEWAFPDSIAGIALATVLVPSGMGYASASGLPVEHGLYASIAALIGYFLFGPSRILILGPDSSLTALIAAAVLPAVGAAPDRSASSAAMLAILSGGICIAGAACRVGFLTDLISKPIRLGYLNGIALTVIAGQLPRLLGLSGQAAAGESLLADLSFLARELAAGHQAWPAVAVGVSCLALIIGLRVAIPRVPGVILAVLGSAIAVALCRQQGWPTPAVVGAVPAGLPMPALPQMSITEIWSLLPAAAAIALVSFADTSVLSRAFSSLSGSRASPNRELAALGGANLLAGLLRGFPVSSSSTRTPVVVAAGAQTQVAGLVGAGCVAALLAWAPGLLAGVPQATLAAVVISACASLLDIGGFVRLFQSRVGEFAVSIVCLAGVALFGVIPGIFMAVAISLAEFVWRAWRPYDAVLGRVDGLKGYHDVSRHPDARRIPGLVLFRWDSPLFFANSDVFREHVLDAIETAPTPTRRIVVAAEPVTDVDITAADMLCELADELCSRGVELGFAEMKGPVKDRLKRYGVFDRFGAERFQPTLGQAVDAYLVAHPVEWHDWGS